MTYRDENDALRARVSELEEQLQASNAKVAELSGQAPKEAVTEGETLGAPTSLGAPSSLVLERWLDLTPTTEGYEVIARIVRERLGLEARQVGQSLLTKGDRFTLEVKGGRTRIRLAADWRDRSSGAWVASGLVAALGGLGVAAVLHDTLHLGDAMAAANLLWAAPALAVAARAFFGPRARALVQRELEASRGAFAAVLEAAAQHRVEPAVRARVAVEDAAEVPETDAAAQAERERTP